jgi:hypothetical protein
MDQYLLSVVRLLIYELAEVHQIRGDVSVVIPGHMDILGLLKRLSLGRRRRVSCVFRHKLKGRSKASNCNCGIRDRRVICGLFLGFHVLLSGTESLERVLHLTCNIDDQVKSRSFLRGRLKVQEHIVRVDADWSVRIPRCLLILIVLNLAKGLNVKRGPVGDLGFYWGVLLCDCRV